MTLVLSGVDHIHVNVSDRGAAEKWYEDIFGFKPVATLSRLARPGASFCFGKKASKKRA